MSVNLLVIKDLLFYYIYMVFFLLVFCLQNLLTGLVFIPGNPTMVWNEDRSDHFSLFGGSCSYLHTSGSK